MPKYDKISSQRTRRSDVLLPKPHRFWMIINSGIFLWLMSAILFTLGGAYFTNHQACVRDADSTIEKFIRITDELYSQRNDILSRSIRAGSMNEVREVIAHPKKLYPEFKDDTIFTLTQQQIRFVSRFDYSQELPPRLSDNGAKQEDIVRFEGLWMGYVSDDLTDDYLAAYKSYAKLLMAQNIEKYGIDQNQDLHPNCSVRNVFRTALGERARTVRIEY